MLWKDKINDWKKGKYLTYPKKIKKPFFYETSCISKKMNEKYKEKFIETNKFNRVKQNHSVFEKNIKKSKNKNVISFYNLSKTSLLIVPYPKKNKDKTYKNYKTLKNFIDNSSEEQQIKFWKKVASGIKRMLKKNDKIWVSTHGLGVPYLHIRIDTVPKYYITKKFK